MPPVLQGQVMGARGGALRAQVLNRSVSRSAGLLTTVSTFGLLAPVVFEKTGGSTNLTIDTSGNISAAAGLSAGQTQSLSGLATGADGVVIPFTANLTGQASAPAAPTVTLTSGNGMVSVSWSANDNGGLPITAYRIYAGPSASNLTLLGTIVGIPPFVETGLTNGVARFYAMSAVNAAGEGLRSGVQSVTPAASANNLSRPSISGTATDGSTLTCTPGTWSGGTATRQWMRDGVAIAGQTGLTYTYVAATDDGCYITVVETNGSAQAASNAIIGLKTAGAPVTFNPSDKAAEITLSSGNLAAQNTINSNRLVRATVAASGKVYFEATFTGLANSAIIGVSPAGQPTADWVGGANGSSGYTNSAGIFSNGGNNTAAATFTNGDVIGVALDTATRKIWFSKNGTWQNGSPAAGTGGVTLSGTGALFAAFSSDKASPVCQANFGGTAFASSPPSGFTAYDPNLLPVGVTGTSVSSAGSAAGQPRVTATGKTNGTPTQLQAAVMSSTGQILQPWADVAGLSGSDFTFTTGDLPVAAQGGTVKLLVRDKIVKNTATAVDVAVGYYSTIFPTVIGLNEGFWAQWNPADPTNDIVERGRWAKADYNDLPAANLDPASLRPISYPAGDTSVILVLGGSFYTPGDVFVLTYPPAMTVTAAVIANATVTQSFSGGSGEVTMGTGEVSLNLRFSGPIPTGGILASFKRKGLSSTKRYTAVRANDYAEGGFKIARYLTPSGTNTIPPFPPTAASPITGEAGCTPEAMCEFANDTATDVYITIHHLADDSYVTSVANTFAANLNPTRRLYIELSNELWNSIFPVHDYARRTGSAMGFYNTAGNAAPSVIVQGQFNPDTGATLAAYTAGTRIYGNLYGTGWQVWEAVGNQPVGSVLAPTSNANWTVVASNGQTATAGRRWQARRSKEVFALFDAAFGATARARTVRVLGAWAAADTTATLAERLLWDNLYQNLDRVAIAPYWGDPFGAYAAGADYDWPGFGMTEKALYATNVEAWKTALFNAAPSHIDAVINRAASLKQGLESMLRQAPYNLPPDTIRLMSYEANHHLTMKDYPNQPAAVAAFNSFRADARLGTTTAYYLSQIKAKLGGEHLLFDSVWAPVAAGASLAQGWGLMFKQGDRTNPQFNAVKAWISANT